MSRLLRLSLVAACLTLIASPSHAARLYFTTSGSTAGGGAPKAGVPEISLTPGEVTDLYVWVDLKGDVGGDGNDTFMAGYGLDIVATNPGIVETVSSTLYNPELTLPNFGGAASGVFRWGTPFRAPDITAGAAGGALLAGDAAGTFVNTNGAAGIAFNGLAVLPGQPSPAFAGPLLDPGYDATNDVFLAQHIQLRAAAGVAGVQSTGIVMQVGLNAFSIDNTAGREDVFFGAGTNAIANNAVGTSDGTIHANITVNGGTTGRTNVFEFGGDPTGATSVPFTGVQTVDIPIGAPAGKLLFDDAWLRNGNFEVYFDLSFSDPGTDIDDVLAMLQGQGIDALPGRPLDNSSVVYDLRIVVPGTPGNDLLLDFDFSAGGLAGVSVESVGVPEPSTFVLAGLGCVGLLAFRRRKA